MQPEAENPLTTSDEIERDIKVGSVVTFAPKDAIGGAQGLRKSIKGRVGSIDKQAGTALVGEWLVPLSKVQRLRKYVFRDWQRQEAKAVREHVYGGLARGEKGRLRTCAADARKAFMAPIEYTGPADAGFYVDVKRARDRFMREKGIEDTSDVGQCSALAVLLERALQHGKKPDLDSIIYKSAESGAVGVGDTLRLVGKPYKLTEITNEGKAVLQGAGRSLEFPFDSIPTDAEPVKTKLTSTRETPMSARAHRPVRRSRERKIVRMPGSRRSAFRYHPERKSPTIRSRRYRGRRTFWDSRPKYCYRHCFGRDRGGRFTSLKRASNPPAPNWLPWIAGGVLIWALLRPKGVSHA